MRFLPAAALLSVGVLVSQLSVAGTPASSPQQLGAVQAAIDFCSKMGTATAKRIEHEAKETLPDMTEARVAAARHDAEFEKTYQVIASVMNGLNKSDATRICGASPGQGQKPLHHRKS